MRKILSLLPRLGRMILGLLEDSRVSAGDKAILLAVLAYLLNPADFVPDAVPFFGLVDDLYLLALALLRLLSRVDEEVLRAHWTGDEDLVPLLKRAVSLAVRILPERVRRALIGELEGGSVA